MEIEKLRTLCHDNTIAMTQHALLRIAERGISLDDIQNGILTGRIIEEYPEDYPFPSCLILGEATTKRPMHVVASSDGEFLHIITAYFPDPIRWESDFATRKEG